MTTQKADTHAVGGPPAAADNRKGAEGRASGLDVGREPRGLQSGIADADRKARTGKHEERVRDTPPAGHWNETSHD
jgi:hypothetical protein